MLYIIYYIKGYLKIFVSGSAPERFMNLCAARNILLWGIQRKPDGYEMNISLTGYLMLRDILHKTATKAVIRNRIGLPFLLKKIKKRSCFFLFFFLIVIVFFVSQLFIWNFQIEGNISISGEQIEECLNQAGIHRGIYQKYPDMEEIERMLCRKFPVITWISVSVQGTTMLIEIRENETGESISDEKIPKEGIDLCASEDGIISKIFVRRGTPLKKINDEVKKGDVIVQGIVEIYTNDGEIKERIPETADADIRISCQVKKEFVTSIWKIEYEKTGRRKKYPYFSIDGKYYILGLFKLSFKHYTTSTEVFWKNKPEIGILTIEEQEEKKIKKTDFEIKKNLERLFEEYMKRLEEKGIQIRKKNVNIVKEKQCGRMKVLIELEGPFVSKKKTVVIWENTKK